MILYAMRLLRMLGRFRRYDRYEDMPSFLLFFFGLLSLLPSCYYGFVLREVSLSFYRVASGMSIVEWGFEGWFLLSFIAVIGVGVWYFGAIAVRCEGILRRRLFV